MDNVIYLIGFMGAGKSTVGPLVAEALQKEFFDSDAELEKHLGRTISDIFAQDGEAVFRHYESEILTILNQTPGCVIAVGGGAPTIEKNWDMFERGITIYLNVSVQTLAQRLNSVQRPLLNKLPPKAKQAKIKSMLNARQSFYRRANFIVDAEQPPELVLDDILEKVISCSSSP